MPNMFGGDNRDGVYDAGRESVPSAPSAPSQGVTIHLRRDPSTGEVLRADGPPEPPSNPLDALREKVIKEAREISRGRGLRELMEAVDAFAAASRLAATGEDTARLNHLQDTQSTLYICSHLERRPRTTIEGGHDTVTVFDGWCVNASGEEKPTVREAIDSDRFLAQREEDAPS